jgi:hypothetical protein
MTAVPPLWRFLAAGAVLAALALLVGSAQGHSGAPKLRLVDASPLRIVGSGFSSGERVRVRARAGGAKRTRHVRANADGRFRVRFARLAQDPCSESMSATAVGSDGHRATLKHVRRQCPPDLRPEATAAPDDPPASQPGPGPAPDPCLTGGRACPPSL